MRNGLYKVEFNVLTGRGGGVVVLQDGVLRGGDGVLFYVGRYSQDGGQVSAEVHTQRHAAPDQGQSLFGRDAVKLHLEGTGDDDSAELRGMAVEAPDVQFQAWLTRLSD